MRILMTTATKIVPYGFCQCGCGHRAPIAKRTNACWGHVKGEPIQFILAHANIGRKHSEETRLRHSCNLSLGTVLRLYQQEMNSLHKTANILGVSATAVRNHLIKHGVPIRARSETRIKHNLSNNPVWKACWGARDRCTNQKHAQYRRYGERGIEFRFKTVEEATRYVLRVLGPRPTGRSLDRKNNDGHYEKGNLRWATRKEQQNNRGAIPLRKKDNRFSRTLQMTEEPVLQETNV